MAVKNVPAQTVITCDRCGVECKTRNYIHNSKLTLVRAGLDFQGQAVADASIRADLCDRCSDKVLAAVSAALKEGAPNA